MARLGVKRVLLVAVLKKINCTIINRRYCPIGHGAMFDISCIAAMTESAYNGRRFKAVVRVCMFTFIKKLLLLAALLLVAAVAAKLFVEFKLQQQLDGHIAAVNPIASIHYERIYLDLEGGVNIDGLDVSPLLLDAGVNRIATIRLSAENKWLFVLAALGLSNVATPNALSVELTGVDLGLISSAYLDDHIASANASFSENVEPSCGVVQFLSGDDFRAMGYGPLIFDANINYGYSSVRKVLDLNLELVVPELAIARVKAVVAGVASLNPSSLLVATKPSLQLIELDYTDSGYIRRVGRYCSDMMNLPVEAFVHREVGRDGNYYMATWGVNPGISVREAYREFLLDPGSINFAAYPSEAFSYEQLSLYAPEDWADLLKLSLLVNDHAVIPLEFSFDRSAPAFASDASSVEGADVVHVPRFVGVKKRELAAYVGYKVRVYSVSGRMRQGFFKGVRKGNIEMISEKYGDSMVVSVSLLSAETVEVYK